MKRNMSAATALLLAVASIALGACLGPLVAPTATSIVQATQVQESPTDAGAVATELAPEEMPTAEPLWTATHTPQPTPESTATPEAASTPVPTPTVGKPPLNASVVALVNGIPVERAKFDAQLAQAEASFVQQPGFDPTSEAGKLSLLELREQVLGWLIDQILIEQAAANEGIAISDKDIDLAVARLQGRDKTRFEAWLTANGLTEETLREQVRLDLLTNAMRDRVTSALTKRTVQVRARHILLSSEEAANAALTRLQSGESFITVARDVSEDETTRANGGDLGFMPCGVMPPAFDEAASALEVGEISGIVRSDFGLHIIVIVEIDPDREVPDDLWPVVQQRAFDDWLAAQRAAADIERNTELVSG
jgi:foldase protein PrsA